MIDDRLHDWRMSDCDCAHYFEQRYSMPLVCARCGKTQGISFDVDAARYCPGAPVEQAIAAQIEHVERVLIELRALAAFRPPPLTSGTDAEP